MSYVSLDPTGPERAALDLLEAIVVDRDIRAAWPLIDRNFRLSLAQLFIWENRDRIDRATSQRSTATDVHALRDRLAERLSAAHLLDDDWSVLQQWLLRLVGDLPDGPWNLVPTRFLDSDRAFVEFLGEGRTFLAAGEWVPGVTFLMLRRGDRWRLAGFREDPPTPGWPPLIPGLTG